MRRPLAAYLAWRLAAGAAFVLVVSASAFLLTRLAPGDAATDLALGPGGTRLVEQTRARLHLDQPIVVQLGSWLGGLARFDLGESSLFGQPVAGLLGHSAARTATLATVALSMAVLVALPIGLATGAHPRSMLARIVTPISLALVACPPIVGALVLLWLALSTGVLPVATGSLVVPALALALPLGAMIERLQSQATAEALAAPDLVAVAARGVAPARLLWVHAARQSVRPLLGIFGIVIGSLFSGSLAVELVTSWPGLGRLMYNAVINRDAFLVAGCALAGGTLIALGNVAADLAHAIVDPRVRERA